MVRARLRPVLLVCAIAQASLAASPPAASQVVPVRTVPVASGDQHLFLPSATLGMGGLTLVVDDTLGAPWYQPGRGARLEGGTLVASPTFYGISDRGGGGRTFPVAVLFGGDVWFGGVSLALQEIDNEAGRGDWTLIDPIPGFWPQPRLSDASLRNVYARGFLGRRLGQGPWSLGVAASVAELDAMDGVDLLYATAERIEQDGTLADLRLGLFREGDRDRIGLLLLHDRVDMTHDVTFLDILWPPEPEPGFGGPVVERRLEVNRDRTRTWGLHGTWDRSLDAPGWRVGASATANRKSHPAIPDYEIQNIPRDPGTTWAWEVAGGVARSRGGTTFGLEAAVQPIWSETWQEALGGETSPSGRVFREGERTVENDFFFTNVVLRAGVAQRWSRLTARAGLELRSYDYELDQRDRVEGSLRTQEESWMEWSPTAGLVWRVSDLELSWTGRVTTGTGQPGVAFTPERLEAAGQASDFIVAPSGPLTLQEATVVTNQFVLRVAIR